MSADHQTSASDSPASGVEAPTRAHGSIHVNVGDVPAPLFCAHDDGTISIEIIGGSALHVWLTGTPDELHAFASRLHRLANRATRELVVAPHEDMPRPPVTLPKVDAPESAA